jgi:hypothetical protein
LPENKKKKKEKKKKTGQEKVKDNSIWLYAHVSSTECRTQKASYQYAE